MNHVYMVMTREEIMAMPAGPDLDRLVAEALGEDTSTLTEHQWREWDEPDDGCSSVTCDRCFEIRYTCPHEHERPGDCMPPIPFYSTSVAPAWKAWEVMRQKVVYVSLIERGGSSGCWRESGVRITRDGDSAVCGNTIWGDTVPLAICRAFLIWKLEEGR